jgi:hypothetical protein
MGAESHHISLHSLAHIVHISGEATSRLPSLRSRLVESTLSSSTLTSPLSSFRPTPLPSARQVDCLLFLHFVFVVHGPTATSSTSSCRVYFLIFSPLVHLPSLRTRYSHREVTLILLIYSRHMVSLVAGLAWKWK